MIPVEQKITQAEKDFLKTMATSVIVKKILQSPAPRLEGEDCEVISSSLAATP